MSCYSLICLLLSLSLIHEGGAGDSCEDIDPLACAHMAKQNDNLCSEPVLSQSACPKLCGNCPTTCYNCNITSPDVSACNTVTCDKNMLCLMEKITSTRTHHTRYKLGCATETFCDTGMRRDIHSRSLTINCCDTDLCNVPLTTTTSTTSSSSSSKTTTTTQTSSTTTAMTTVFDPCKEGPCEHGTCHTTGNTFYCTCHVNWIGKSCDTHDPCSTSPCLHGNCANLKNSSFQCTCKPGYSGRLCDTVLDYCMSNPCVNGNCSSTLQSYTCTCDQGWMGYTCSVTDPCSSSPCVHGACTILTNSSFHCTCQSGYTGVNCETVLDHCMSNPCAHGNCSSTPKSYDCLCGHGWMGSTCNVPDPCTNSPCYNGICSGLENGTFYCKCNSGYTGQLCDFAANPCSTNPCLHGTCTPVGRRFMCSCQQGWTGNICNSLIDHCASSPCVHGQCTSDLTTYNCSCNSGYVGTRCSHMCNRDVLITIDQTLLNYYDDQSVIFFLQHLVQKMHIGYNGVYLQLSTFDGTNVHNKWSLTSYTYQSSLLHAIGQLQRHTSSGPSDIFLPINSIYYQGLRGHGDRYYSPDVALIITGQFRNSQFNLKAESDRINAIIPIITIGVGSVNTQTLTFISKDSRHALRVTGLSDLVDDDFENKVLNLICT